MAVILVIDDAATVRHLMRRVLAEAEHTVIEAQDGEVGLSLFEAQRPALVITDLFMPNREGIETIQQLRRLSSIQSFHNARQRRVSGGERPRCARPRP